MPGKGDVTEADILKLYFNGTAISGIADNTATSPLANLFIALHTADPTDAGNQTSNEIVYTGYARKSVARNSGAFNIAGTSPTTLTFVADQDFPPCTAGSGTATFASIGDLVSGAGRIFWYGLLTPSIAVVAGVTPRIKAAGSTITEE